MLLNQIKYIVTDIDRLIVSSDSLKKFLTHIRNISFAFSFAYITKEREREGKETERIVLHFDGKWK